MLYTVLSGANSCMLQACGSWERSFCRQRPPAHNTRVHSHPPTRLTRKERHAALLAVARNLTGGKACDSELGVPLYLSPSSHHLPARASRQEKTAPHTPWLDANAPVSVSVENEERRVSRPKPSQNCRKGAFVVEIAMGPKGPLILSKSQATQRGPLKRCP